MYVQPISHGNVLSFTPPGFSQVLNVKFPDSRLAVCEKCKKNYKTRDMCRVRNSHTTEPWTTAYICITLDDSCIDENGKYVDKPLSVRMVPWQPYSVKECFDSKTPVCAACKKTNRTRSFCRTRHQHKALPWCTVYVVLSATDAKPVGTSATKDSPTKLLTPSKSSSNEKKEQAKKPKSDDKASKSDKEPEDKEAFKASEIKSEESLNGEHDTEKTKVKEENDDDMKDEDEDEMSNKALDNEERDTKLSKKAIKTEESHSKNHSPSETEGKKTASKKTSDEDSDNSIGDDIHDIASSKTFLAKVSCRNISIHWLEISDYDANSAGISSMVHSEVNGTAFDPSKATTMTPNVAHSYDPSQYYAQMTAMGYPNLTQQQQMQMQQQHFLQMQQRQHFAAQQAAWQQYNQHVMAMNGQMMAHPGLAMMNPMAMQAAQQQAQPNASGTTDETKKDGNAQVTPQAAQAGNAAALQAQAQAQWQAQMMYQQQLYHQQFQMQQHMAAQQHQMMAQQAPGMYFAAQQSGATPTPAKPAKEEPTDSNAAKRQKTAEI